MHPVDMLITRTAHMRQASVEPIHFIKINLYPSYSSHSYIHSPETLIFSRPFTDPLSSLFCSSAATGSLGARFLFLFSESKRHPYNRIAPDPVGAPWCFLGRGTPLLVTMSVYLAIYVKLSTVRYVHRVRLQPGHRSLSAANRPDLFSRCLRASSVAAPFLPSLQRADIHLAELANRTSGGEGRGCDKIYFRLMEKCAAFSVHWMCQSLGR